MEIAPGIRRLGSGKVNVYLIEEAGAITIVDAGLPGYCGDLQAELTAMGRSLDDVRAVLLTHAHTDHIGFAERIRRERGVPIRVHEADAALARGEVKQHNEGGGRRGCSQPCRSSCTDSARASSGSSTSGRSRPSGTAPPWTSPGRRASSTSPVTRRAARRSTCRLATRSSSATPS